MTLIQTGLGGSSGDADWKELIILASKGFTISEDHVACVTSGNLRPR